jgi:hypothetical protein
MEALEWQDPPEKSARSSKWSKVFDQLAVNKDRWAKLYEGKDRNAHSLAGRLRKQYGKDYEIKSTKIPDHAGTAGVWARYVGLTLDEKMERDNADAWKDPAFVGTGGGSSNLGDGSLEGYRTRKG